MAAGEFNRDEEWALLKQCLAGDAGAMRRIRESYHTLLVGLLQQRGANATEAEDLVADLWGECVASNDHPSLLEKFSGKCALRTWLIAVATHRLVDLKRRDRFRADLPSGNTRTFERLSTPIPLTPEEALTNLLRDSLKRAFTQCTPESLLLLRLVYMYGLTQREAGRMWGWHESKVSRALTDAMQSIAVRTMDSIQRKDAWLQLNWQDFLDLCQARQVGFL